MVNIPNPYDRQTIYLPKKLSEKVKKYVLSSEQGSKVMYSPFPRQVDFWFLAICIAAQNGKIPSNKKKRSERSKVEMGSILSSDPWRISFVSMIALSLKKDPEILSKPNEVIELMNNLAEDGIMDVLSYLEKGNSEPMTNLSIHLLDIMKSS